jgi:hypothetical protein
MRSLESKTSSPHHYTEKVDSIIDNALVDIEAEKSRVDLSWISRYPTQLQSIALALHNAAENQEIDDQTAEEKSSLLLAIHLDILAEQKNLDKKYGGRWHTMNTIEREKALAEFFTETKMREYMGKMRKLRFSRHLA